MGTFWVDYILYGQKSGSAIVPVKCRSGNINHIVTISAIKLFLNGLINWLLNYLYRNESCVKIFFSEWQMNLRMGKNIEYLCWTARHIIFTDADETMCLSWL